MTIRSSILFLLSTALLSTSFLIVPLFAADTDNAPILTPPSGPAAQIHGPKIFGVRPNHPFLYTIPATGTRPITFFCNDLPEGLSLDASTGQITGTIKETVAGLTPRPYYITLGAKNALNETERPFKIIVGDNIALTPPMGWNSWNCWAAAVDQDKVLASAQAMVDKGLINHGWSYINIDDTWQGKRGGQFNAIQPNEKFPDMKALSDKVHAMGLKLGIYSTPWKTSYAGYIGGSSDNQNGDWDAKIETGKKGHSNGKFPFANNDAQQWAAWGIDYLKYDWNPKNTPNMDIDPFPQQIAEMANALNNSGRDILFSYSNSFPIDSIADNSKNLNAWRTTGDIRDNWGSLADIWKKQNAWTSFSSPGHWNDPDMLVVGYVGWGKVLHPSNLTPDEQYTHISLWALLSAPMLIGCDMTRLDPFTLSLLTNDEVIDIDQDPLGKQAAMISSEGPEVSISRIPFSAAAATSRPATTRAAATKPAPAPIKMPAKQVWAKELQDGSKAVGLFNLSDTPTDVTVQWADLKITGKQTIRDVWRQKDLDTADSSYTATIAPHGVLLLKIQAPN